MSKAGTPTGKRGIYRRNNTLYARIVIPSDLREFYGTREVWRTLQTNDLSIAQYRASIFFHQIKSEFAVHRGEQSHVKDALMWKKTIAKGEQADAEKIATYRRQNPDKELPPSFVEALGLEDPRTSFSYYLDDLREQKGDEVAGLVADIVYGTSLPTLLYLDEWKATLMVIPRTLQQADAKVKLLADKFPSLPIKKSQVAKWIIEQEQAGKAEETIKGLIGTCRSYYGYLQRVGHLSEDEQNPFEGHRYTKKKKASRMDERQAWELSDYPKLAQAAKQKRKDKNLFSLIILGAYTGARIEELARLKTSDVKEKEGIRYFEIGVAKSKAGLRDIPIHNDILPFIDQLIAESTDGYLLPDEPETGLGERSSAIGKRFGRLKTQLGYDGRYVFHSFRKTMATQLERLGLHHNEAAEIIGHEKLGETYGRYSKGLPITKKAEIVYSLSFPRLLT